MALHGELARAWELRVRPEEIVEWRHRVTETVKEWDVARGAEDTVSLGVTELLSNVHRHAGDPHCWLRLRRLGAFVVVSVDDRFPQAPRVVEPGPSALGGRGLWLLRVMVDGHIGWVRTDEGKRIWFSAGPSDAPTESGA
ncbi:ATP-binding protein [Streptomyces radicis]|uniref:ATP-binding protein n=1 Tax=Streptomyces radicis TaxID=1750517 RepID=UPI001603FA47|nr:ATP-binding protein [Streptomyces radicis]